jgi:hypothetical protein
MPDEWFSQRASKNCHSLKSVCLGHDPEPNYRPISPSGKQTMVLIIYRKKCVEIDPMPAPVNVMNASEPSFMVAIIKASFCHRAGHSIIRQML